MLRTAKDCLKIREEKLNIFNKSQEEIKRSNAINRKQSYERKY